MPIELLNTKLYIPPVRLDLVPRPRLFSQLGPTATNRLILISAPAGYGKTTLISSWLQGNSIAATWLSLDESDNDPIRFLQYLIKALQQIIPTLDVELPSMLQGVPSDSTMNLLLNALAQQASPFVLGLDDFHVIQSQPVLDMITVLVERMPPQMRLILLSRTDPPLPLARWRARHQMVEIRASQLRLSKDEIDCFLRTTMQLGLSDDDLGALEARTEGWIAGLQLAGLSMQSHPDVHAFVTAFTGSQHYIMDYLVQEVLKRQPEPVRTFLLETSVLDRLCGSLCEAVIGDTTKLTDGQAMLQELEQRNLFLIPLDGERRWYRYHHLFADMLNRHLEREMPSQIHELHLRASEWLERQGFIPEAIQHTLMAQDTERAIRLVEQNGCLLLMAGEVVTLNRWLEAVTPFAPTHPWFAILKGWVLTLTGQQDQVSPILQSAERLLAPLEVTPIVQIMRGALNTAQAHSARIQGDPVAAEFARQALACLPTGDVLSDSLRSVASLILGDVSRMNGEMEEATQAYNEAMRIGLAADNPHLLILGNSNLADILFEQGQLHLAARKLSDALQMATRSDRSMPLIVDGVLGRLSQLAFEWNDLEGAERYARQCVELCQTSGNLEWAGVGNVMLARLEHVRGNAEKTIAAMRLAEQLACEYHASPQRSTWVQCALARLWLAQGNFDKVAHFLRQKSATSNGDLTYPQEPVYRILLRMLLAQKEFGSALVLSGRLLQFAEATKCMGRVIEILVLRTIASQGKQDLAQALSVLEKALALAQPERYVRVFLDEGEAMARLLYHAKAHHRGTGFVSELLAEMPNQSDGASASAQSLIEPLSARELEVLGLIAVGDANEEIAAKLIISIKTAKRHISNIYAKLGAKNRTQAVALARGLKLVQ